MVKAAKTIKKTVEKRQSVKYNDAYEMLQSTTEHIKKEKLRDEFTSSRKHFEKSVSDVNNYLKNSSRTNNIENCFKMLDDIFGDIDADISALSKSLPSTTEKVRAVEAELEKENSFI